MGTSKRGRRQSFSASRDKQSFSGSMGPRQSFSASHDKHSFSASLDNPICLQNGSPMTDRTTMTRSSLGMENVAQTTVSKHPVTRTRRQRIMTLSGDIIQRGRTTLLTAPLSPSEEERSLSYSDSMDDVTFTQEWISEVLQHELMTDELICVDSEKAYNQSTALQRGINFVFRFPPAFEPSSLLAFRDPKLEECFGKMQSANNARRFLSSLGFIMTAWTIFLATDVMSPHWIYRIVLRLCGLMICVICLIICWKFQAFFAQKYTILTLTLTLGMYLVHHFLKIHNEIAIPLPEMVVLWIIHAFLGLRFTELLPFSLLCVAITFVHSFYMEPRLATAVIIVPPLLGTVWTGQMMRLGSEFVNRRLFIARIGLYSLDEVQAIVGKTDLNESAERIVNSVKGKSGRAFETALQSSRCLLHFRLKSLEAEFIHLMQTKHQRTLLVWLSNLLLIELLTSGMDMYLAWGIKEVLIPLAAIRLGAIVPVCVAMMLFTWKGPTDYLHMTLSVFEVSFGFAYCVMLQVVYSSREMSGQEMYTAHVVRYFMQLYVCGLFRHMAGVAGLFVLLFYFVMLFTRPGTDLLDPVFSVAIVLCGTHYARGVEVIQRQWFLVTRAYQEVLRSREEVDNI